MTKHDAETTPMTELAEILDDTVDDYEGYDQDEIAEWDRYDLISEMERHDLFDEDE